jgi:hypothetical protein
MSILDRLKAQDKQEGKKLFGVVAGPRLGGKSTLAGTLPGKTLMLQVAVLESGSKSARALSESLGNQLDVLSFSSMEELTAITKDLATDTTYDNVYLDGLSALSELKIREPRIQALIKKDVWSGYRELGDDISNTLLQIKALTYPSATKKPKNVIVTCALAVKTGPNGNVVDVELEAKGRVAVTQVTKLGEFVVTVLPPIETESGSTGHRMLTRTVDNWPGRADGVLDSENPGMIAPANLGELFKLINKEK